VSMPLTLKIGLAAIIAVSVSAAAASKPPREVRPGLTGLVLGASVIGYAVAGGLLVSGHSIAGAMALVLASEGMCLAAWLGRAIIGEDDDDGWGGGNDRRPPNGLPNGDGERPSIDWSSFESFRKSWSRERLGSGNED
jgi:hypothetical protein